MKNNKYILGTSILLMLFAGSCTKLDEKLYNQVSVDDFGKSQAEINALVGPIYSTLKNYSIDYGSLVTMDELSAGMMAIPVRKGGDWYDGGMYQEMMEQNWSGNSTGYAGVYENAMANIALCNQIYYQINTNPVVSGDSKEEVLAEIRGVRAFWYYILCDNYGNVPIVTDFLDQSLPATKSRKEVYAFVVNELNDIKDKLRSDGATAASYGKFTKGAAFTILAKMYLNAEIWNPDDGAKWQECSDACDSVMALPYVLENNWKTNFIVHNEVSQEAILSAVFQAGGSGVTNNLALNTLHSLDAVALGLNIVPWNGIAAAPDYVKTFDTTDLRYNGSFLIGPMIDPQTGSVLITDDGRPLIHTVDITMHDVDADGWGWVNTEDGARCYKWDFEPGLSTDMENDFHIFRLADVYLMKAEAILRGGGDNAEATTLVNRIRSRAFSDPSKLLSSVTLNDIYKERRYELAWEGYARQDMIRFGTFLLPRQFKPYTSDDMYLLFPIPQADLDANSNLIQNPGY